MSRSEGIHASTAFYVGFRGCSSASEISIVLSGLLAFLTAKSLPLGAERDPGEGISRHLFHKGVAALPYHEVYFDAQSQRFIYLTYEFHPYHRLQIKKSAAAMGRVCSAIDFVEAEPDAVARAPDLQVYKFNPSALEAPFYKVLYNPAFCVSKFYALFKDEKLDVLRDGSKKLDRGRLGRVLPLFLMIVFLMVSVVDVIIGVVMRLLQTPYYVLMFLWHQHARDCEASFSSSVTVSNASRAKVQVDEFKISVFVAKDKVFTCFAVVVNSVILGLLLHSHSKVLGFGAVAIVCVALAVLTVFAVFLTASNLNTTHKWIQRGNRGMINVVCGEHATSFGLAHGDNAVRIIQENQASCEAMVDARTIILAQMLYWSEIGRGACLPSHFRAGFGGTTAFSFVEEVLHAPSHLLASAAITLVERGFGDKGSPPSAENTVTLVERGFGDKGSPPSAENTTIVVAQSEQHTGRGCRFPLL